MPHRGIRQYQGDESGNVGLGQLGFKVLDTSGESTGDGNFFMIKVLGGLSTAEVVRIAVTTHQGDGSTGSAINLDDVLTGEVVYGCFKNITITTPGTDVKVLCYYGSDI